MFATRRANGPSEERGRGRAAAGTAPDQGPRPNARPPLLPAARNADVAWGFLDLLSQGGLDAALDCCAPDVVLHVDAGGFGGGEEVTAVGREAAAAFLARLLAPGRTGRIRKKGLMVHGGRLAVMAATADRDPVILRFALEESLIRELWLEL
ncbi:MAG: nuclear transport factor 2 family protein [Actinobacteria bacterium]|nr:nuclear transport factor 2 family protein [Actinomycetota bacterium]